MSNMFGFLSLRKCTMTLQQVISEIPKVATAQLFKVEVGRIFEYLVYSNVSQHLNILWPIQIFVITILYV